MTSVVIASPVCQDPDILSVFLQSLEELDTTEITVSYLFADNNNSQHSKKMLNDFIQRHTGKIQCVFDQGPVYIKDENSHFWNDSLVWKVAEMKNGFVRYAMEQKVDYLFLIDSDLILHPKTLKQLLAGKKEIISNVFWTAWTQGAMEMPQVWLEDEYSMYTHINNKPLTKEEKEAEMYSFMLKLREPGIYRVGGLGACTLIHKKALAAGVHFSKIYNLSFWGEDRHFCIRAAALGFQLFVDTTYPAFHVYRKNDLNRLASVKKRWHALLNG